MGSTPAENEKAGRVIFQNESPFYFLAKTVKSGRQVLELYKSITGDDNNVQLETLVSKELADSTWSNKLFLKIAARAGTYAFYYSFEPDKWEILADGIDGKYLSTRVAGGFVGCIYAMYATSSGIESDNNAYFDWFEQTNEDDIYKQ